MNHCANTKFEHASMLALAMWQNTFRRTEQTQTQTQTQTQKHALIFACIHVYYLHFQLCACLLFHFLLQPKSIIMADKQHSSLEGWNGERTLHRHYNSGTSTSLLAVSKSRY